MARKPRRKPAAPRAASDGKSNRERVIAAFMALLAEKPIERIGFAAIGSTQSRSRTCLERARRPLTAMDAHGGRYRQCRPARHAARAGTLAAVCVGAADLGGRRRPWSCPDHGRTRPRARARPALVG